MRILVIDDEAEVGATLIAAVPTRRPTPTRRFAPTSPFMWEGVFVRVPSPLEGEGQGGGMRYSAATEAA
jgi:hypothetical protein